MKKPRTVYVMLEIETSWSLTAIKGLYKDASNLGWGVPIAVNQVVVSVADATKKKAKRRRK